MRRMSGFCIAILLSAMAGLAVADGRTVCGKGTAEPTGYVPVMLSNGSLCMTANRPDAVSMGSLAGYFPFPIFPKGHKEQTSAVDFFLAQGAKAGNMYAMGKKICPWYCGAMAMAALRAGRFFDILLPVRTGGASI